MTKKESILVLRSLLRLSMKTREADKSWKIVNDAFYS